MFLVLTLLMFVWVAILSSLTIFFIMGTFSVSFIMLCLVKNIFGTSIFSVFVFSFQLKTHCLREGPLWCLVASGASLCSVFVLCLQHSPFIASNAALAASTAACAIACFTASVSAISFFLHFFSVKFSICIWYFNFWHHVRLLAFYKDNTNGSCE